MPTHRTGAAHPEPPAGLRSRDRILWAAASMLGEGPGAALSVRAVAERARVSPGSLRHHFPTQRALMDAMLPIVSELVLPRDGIDDASTPPRERLLAVLRRLLLPEGGASLREAWLTAHERYIATEPSQAIRAEYRALQRELRRRLEEVLATLRAEGAVPPGDDERRARFLMTVVNGASVELVMPNGDEAMRDALDALDVAADAVLDGRV
jgi:AcrR family transcriptional regulator